MWSGDDFEIAFVGSQAQLATTTYEKEVRALYTPAQSPDANARQLSPCVRQVLYFQLQGSATLTTPTGSIALPPRSMVLLPPGTPHSSSVRSFLSSSLSRFIPLTPACDTHVPLVDSQHSEGSVCMRLTWHSKKHDRA
jgi:hypothetical protein